MTKCAFLINPHSHTVSTHGSVLEKTKSQYADHYILDDFSNLAKFITQIAANKTELIFIEGGDGSIHGVLTEYLKQQSIFETIPKFILLAGGMTNLIAMQIGIKKPTIKNIKYIIRSPQKAKLETLPLLNIHYKNGDTYQGFLFSTGAIASGTSYTVKEVHSEGINGSAAVRTTLRRALFGGKKYKDKILKPSPLSLSIDGENITGDHMLSVATTLTKPLIGFSPFWGQEGGPLKLSYVQSGAKHLVRNTARFITKNQNQNTINTLAKDGFRSWAVDKAVITHTGPLVLDGEFLPQTNDEITLSTTKPIEFLHT